MNNLGYVDIVLGHAASKGIKPASNNTLSEHEIQVICGPVVFVMVTVDCQLGKVQNHKGKGLWARRQRMLS